MARELDRNIRVTNIAFLIVNLRPRISPSGGFVLINRKLPYYKNILPLEPNKVSWSVLITTWYYLIDFNRHFESRLLHTTRIKCFKVILLIMISISVLYMIISNVIFDWVITIPYDNRLNQKWCRITGLEFSLFKHS